MRGAVHLATMAMHCSISRLNRYVAPEILEDVEAGAGVDLWALGCMLYQMVVGVPPFNGNSDYLTFKVRRLPTRVDSA